MGSFRKNVSVNYADWQENQVMYTNSEKHANLYHCYTFMLEITHLYHQTNDKYIFENYTDWQENQCYMVIQWGRQKYTIGCFHMAKIWAFFV